MQRYCLALDLKADDRLIAEYEAWHRAVWPEILASIRESGITTLEIYRVENRLFMVGNTFDQRRVLNDELLFIEGAGCGVHLSSAFWSGFGLRGAHHAHRQRQALMQST